MSEKTTIELIKELRTTTQAPMSDCKSALDECNNDIEKAIQWLREKGIAKANKKAGSIAAEGIIKAGIYNERAVVIEVNSQTDFVAKNEKFIKLVDDIYKGIASQNSDETDVKDIFINGNSLDKIGLELSGLLGEKIAFRRAAVIKKLENQTLGTYNHSNDRIGVIILINTLVEAEVAKNIAMHIAASNPKFIDINEVDDEWLNNERNIIEKQFEDEMKEISNPKEKENKVNRKDIIIQGRIDKLLNELCLLNQPYIKDPSLKVSDYLKQFTAKVLLIHRYELGEGIAKKQDNFAEEVASQMNTK